jgi:hypothetical protein
MSLGLFLLLPEANWLFLLPEASWLFLLPEASLLFPLPAGKLPSVGQPTTEHINFPS